MRLANPIALLLLVACETEQGSNPALQTCSQEWYQSVEEKLATGDAQGHGPDLGSTEWRSVIEFKLGIRGDTDVPPRESDEWCTFISKKIRT